MTVRPDALYDLLPEVVRASDALAGQPLRALCRVFAGQADVLDADVAGLYENWFAETCDPWVLPYLGELVGYRPVPENAPPADDSPRGRALARVLYPRAEYARTVAHRRRKGSLLELQHLARDAAGWPARAVEFRHLRAAAWAARAGRGPRSGVSLRDEDALARGFGPFDGLPRRPDLRRVASRLTPGRGSVGAVGLWVWRAKVHRVGCGRAYHLTGDFGPPGARVERYLLNPLGVDQQLFVSPEPVPDPVEPAGEAEVPGPLRRQALRADLAAGATTYYGPDRSVCLWVVDESTGQDAVGDRPPDAAPIRADKLAVADLARWEEGLPPRHPFFSRDCKVEAVIDPRCGRVLYRRKGKREQALFARYHVGSAADVGGGGYHRTAFPNPDGLTRTITVGGPRPADSAAAEDWVPTLRQALKLWARAGKSDGREAVQPRRWVVELATDATLRIGRDDEEDAETELRSGEALLIRAAPGVRPVVVHRRARPADSRSRGAWAITAAKEAADPPVFALDGVMLAGTALKLGGRFASVRVRHSTLGGAAGVAVELDTFDGCLALDKSLVLGPILAGPDLLGCAVSGVPDAPPKYPPPRVRVADCVLDGRAGGPAAAVAGRAVPGAADAEPGYIELALARCTLFGTVAVTALSLAEVCVFAGRLRVTNAARGCVRYCALHPADFEATESPTPPRYACQPDLSGAIPRFASTRYGDPGYARLADDCPDDVRRGGTAGGEMGAFHDEYWPQREALLRARLAEFTPAGADARLFFAT